MAIKQPASQDPTSMGTKTGYIHPRPGLTSVRDTEDGLQVKFTLVVFAVTDELINAKEARLFTVWTDGEEAKKLLAAYPDDLTDLPRHKTLVTVDVADEQFTNEFNKTTGKWVNEIKIHARTVAVPAT
ncbi:hypothetical protein OHB05_42290 [Streptomyces sp. NBC_00638]|uniref:hypothetical protein n=1 Tax=Streptomyces sp. NBC_00638 TaxID=2975794 RepID=UPI00224DF7C8|nr:hypothetical protein [Streptomyces sp. NBC_00638]MCX5009150.1 hypothetical protein [Streptomyces sp. NBC_00638]